VQDTAVAYTNREAFESAVILAKDASRSYYESDSMAMSDALLDAIEKAHTAHSRPMYESSTSRPPSVAEHQEPTATAE